MKKLILTAACVATMFSAVSTPNAHAFGIVNLVSTGSLDYVGTPQTHEDMMLTVACIALLPLCILDEESADGVDASALIDSGYEVEEVEAIVVGQEALSAFLVENDKKMDMSIESTDAEKAETLSVVPGMTTEFINFAIDNY